MTCPSQDEAAELIASEGQSSRAEPEAALAYLSQHCELAAVTLGDKGCIAQRQGDTDMVQEPACSGVIVIDATGGLPILLLMLHVRLATGKLPPAHSSCTIRRLLVQNYLDLLQLGSGHQERFWQVPLCFCVCPLVCRFRHAHPST